MSDTAADTLMEELDYEAEGGDPPSEAHDTADEQAEEQVEEMPEEGGEEAGTEAMETEVGKNVHYFTFAYEIQVLIENLYFFGEGGGYKKCS